MLLKIMSLKGKRSIVFMASLLLLAGFLLVSWGSEDSTVSTTVPQTAGISGGPLSLAGETEENTGVTESVDGLNSLAETAAESGNEELADILEQDAELLLAAEDTGEVASPPNREDALALLGDGGDGPAFDPEGPTFCEPPFVPNDIALLSWCYLFTDEDQGIADLVVVAPGKVLLMATVLPTPEATEEALAMTLADPDSAEEALKLTETVRSTREVVRFVDTLIDPLTVEITAARKGANYLLTVNGEAYQITPTSR